MLVLCSVTGSPSHGRAVLPFARALGDAGHRVVVACPPDVAGVFDGAPVVVEPVLPTMADAAGHLGPVLARLGGPAALATLTPAEATTALLPTLFAGPQVTGSARALLALVRAHGVPDLVLRDGGETAGFLVAEHLGVPCVAAPSGAGNVLAPHVVADALTERREELGFAVPDDPAALHRWGRLDCMPQQFSLAEPQVAPARAFRQDDQVTRGETVPGWVAALPGNRPLVLAGLGTAMPAMAGRAQRRAPVDPHAALRTVAEAASRLDAEVVLSTGGLPVDDLDLPPHVHPASWVPQPLLLQVADLFLTHGGYNGIREAVRHGVPLAVLPQFGDQEHNAGRVAELGLGSHCAPDAAEIAATCTRLLSDDDVRARIRSAQRAMLALPPVEDAVGVLEDLAARRVAVLAA
ncbi:Glycosyltransferase [Pseudonocardia sp. Ae406_Ps2]|uniref:glycosyltransferase n=1 Tax=unclassified Pseudonocardia TaxID=2619320 RepID=UPI00094B4058|nr:MULTISPECIES: glycosyltransferase [unclassified Pseudonocardia]OLM02049.1 Glycosyltransferase [Pseudonocardia sp. Ae406_Ps2]OLM06167.1 Glycosyltransferase [Pseudonocardia sp. Ae331_Ps2]